jgi:hypothetical protein
MPTIEGPSTVRLDSADDGFTESALPSCYSAPRSIDAWRHRRMLSHALELIRHDPTATWLTVGDGRFGSDAAFLRSHGADAFASNVTDETLHYAAEHGHIGQFHAENAERLSFPDNHFDHVLCKESYHHFLRPPVALYEMLRVARRAIMMIEPLDEPRPLNTIKQWAKRVVRGDTEVQFEPCGNYLYRTNLRELAKLLTAIGLQMFAFRRFNDFYHPRLARDSASPGGLSFSLTRLGLGVQDLLTATQLLGYGLATVIIFKTPASDDLLNRLRKHGYRLVRLPQNPYR